MTHSPRLEEASQGECSTSKQELRDDEFLDTKSSERSDYDHEIEEKPVREKLKKTSITSMFEDPIKKLEAAETGGNSLNGRSENDGLLDKHSLSEQNDSSSEPRTARGRPVRKRSFDDFEAREVGVDHTWPTDRRDISNGHTRKRSRDVRAGHPFKEGGRLRALENELQEEPEVNTFDEIKLNNRDNATEKGVDSATEPLSKVEIEESKGKFKATGFDREDFPQHEGFVTNNGNYGDNDERSVNHKFNPRQKRGWEQVDQVLDREQKIPATKEARAQRSSEELEQSSEFRNSKPYGLVVAQEEQDEKPELKISKHDKAENDQSKATPHTPKLEPASTQQAAKKLDIVPASFSSSGFAAHAINSTSPFGTIASTSDNTTSSSLSANNIGNNERTEGFRSEKISPATIGFGAFSNPALSSLNGSKASPFINSGAKNSSMFGGSVFGSGFASTYSPQNKLSSFASPSGDTKLGTSIASSQSIGSPKLDGNDSDSNDGNEHDGNEQEDNSEEVDPRFQHQNVETGEEGEETVFTSRATLYIFKDRAWKEAGKGLLKLNVTDLPPDGHTSEPKRARFIMRSFQTFVVLLNASIFKGMQVGDPRGNEPSTRSFAFAQVTDLKAIPYMLKLGDTSEAKSLYELVKKLQDSLIEL